MHLATLLDGREVAMKIQYPGVAKGIESDINNLVSLMNVWNIIPRGTTPILLPATAEMEIIYLSCFLTNSGMYMEEIVKVAKRELSWEVDYIREAECTRKFRSLVQNSPAYKVPEVIGK